jgi:hypothetical protein
MAFSNRWKLVATTAAALTLAFAACGDEKKDGDDGNTPRNDAGSGGPGGLGGLGDFLDGGLDLIAELDDNVAGSACTLNEDCMGKNAVCTVTTADGRGACSGACTANSNCGAGGQCITVASFGETAVSFCAKTCTDDSQCDPELECRETVDVRGVLDSIFELLDGGIEGLNAEDTPKICQEKANTVNLANGAVGKACTASNADSVCGGGTCDVTPLNPGGYCTGMCFEDSHCGNTGGCARDALSSTFGAPGSCRVKCTTDDQCRKDEDYTCVEFELAFGPGKYCAYTPSFDGGFLPVADAGDSSTSDAGTPAADAASGDN